MEVLSVEGLTKTIGKRTLVEDLSFHVNEGEIFGFLGPNGSGKTTTIRMLVGLIRPTRGTIYIGGYHLERNFLQAIEQVGCIVENPELYTYLTGRENLQVFARMVEGITPERLQEVIELVQLDHRMDDTVRTYSLGMKQRLGIAQALLGNPKLLILDEPTNGLDPAGIRELRAFIRRLSREKGMSIFISSHILHELELICDRVSMIYNGKLIYTARMDELTKDHGIIEWIVDPVDRAINILEALEYVKTIELQDGNRILVHMPSQQVSDANQRLVKENITIMSIRPLQKTLEDIFLQMTGGNSLVKSDLQ